ncbi:fumarate reductase [Nocardioides sp. Root1257]|uniref:FAD-dependent oxidoreductase n=1 Tax=unclassified Nocardioides TaxID=2615069 RepID=UPI0006F6F580|nr:MULTISPECIES: FAD-dependent oxidoreductase [unclassified Nocardioides]KQW47401.1 fumarate reductase [Nocardioides sp. Root1257]KRC45557.1 fumarate reductase [Nocardioides sp. Root224]
MTAGLPVEHELPDRVGVLVLGSGLAGCAALLAAAEAGQYAVMLEKTGDIGGSTVRSAGLSAFAGTREQLAQGIGDSVELLKKDLMETGRHVCDEALVDLYCAHQLETYEWLTGHGVEYGEVHAASGQSVPRSHPTDTTGMLVRLLQAAGRLGARLLLDTAAERLVRDDGRVVGVDVRTAGGTHRILADAVVLATGGFARSPELLDRFAPQMRHALIAGGDGCTGDGLLMGWQLGAGVVDTPYVKGTYGIFHEPHPDEDGTGILAVYKGAIAVNRDGRRFVDESLPYKEIGDAALAQPGVTTWQVFDAQVMAQSNDEVPIYEFAGRSRAGMLLEADSVDELEQRIGLPAGALVATVHDYNGRIAAGEPDDLGRAHLSGGVGRPFPLEQPPFYAHPSGTVVLATYCGLTVDTRLRVLDVYGEPIERLYAAGEVIGGFHGGGYMTGTSIGKSGIFGRLAGTHAAAEESELEW